MAGFIRRFGFFPGTEVITAIEGVVIVDLPPPGSIAGVGVGTICCVGEFADMTYAVSVASDGSVTTKPQPVEVYSSQDMFNKVGGFDETLGDTGKAGGNGFITLRNKRFSRLVIVPINLASAEAVRVWRDLPTNKSATLATPVVPIAAAVVTAGREFKTGANRVRICQRAQFTAFGDYYARTDGSVTAAGAPAATQTFSSPGGSFITAKNGGPVQKGDILVLGVIDGAGALGANADTYRVTADATVATQITVEKLDGSLFDWTSGTLLPFRVHSASDADTGGQNQLADAGGYVHPARPLDATIAAATSLAPTLVPPAPTATTWDPLSGLTMRTDPTTGLVYTATIQAANAVNDATIDALYDVAIDSLLTDKLPAREVNILLCSRHSTTIATKQKSHVLAASGIGVGRITVISPTLDNVALATIIGDSAPGVGATRHERVIYNWPGAQTFVPEAVGFALKGADAISTTSGILDTHLDAWMASLLSVLPPERNPGQASSPVPEVMAPIAGFQRLSPELGINDYITLRAKGVAALRIDRTAGPIFQSGITSSLVSGEKNINRRRMADFLEDSLAQRYVQFTKQPLTSALKDAIVGETNAFLITLQSPNNPPAQRILGFIIDDVSGNTPTTEAQGIFVVIVKVRTLSTADFIVLQAEIGENVNVSAQ